MTRIQRWLDSAITAAGIVLGSFAAIALLTRFVGDYCWPERFGGLLVGVAVFLQAHVYANHADFSNISKHGLTREQRWLHKVYLITVFGTFMWAFGDFLPSVFGVPTCKLG